MNYGRSPSFLGSWLSTRPRGGPARPEVAALPSAWGWHVPLMPSALPRLDLRVFKSCAGNHRRTYTASSFVMHAAEEPLLEFQTPDRRWPRC